MIRTRDGVVGPWDPPNPPYPFNLNIDFPDNLKRWESWVRASIVDFELVSRLGFTTYIDNNPDNSKVSLWHLKVTPGATPPAAAYQPLIDFMRPTTAIYQSQLKFLDQYADLRGDRESEIISQLGGGLWFLGSVPFLHPERTKWTIELLTAVIRLASSAEMRVKQGLSARRPVEFSPQVQPMIQTPAHGSTPSGHATETFASALVLLRLLQNAPINQVPPPVVPPQPAPAGPPQIDYRYAQQLMRIASRVAVNRQVAGVHFPVDSACGCLFGLTLGEYFYQRATQVDAQGNVNANAQYNSWHFLGSQFPPPPNAPVPALPPNDGDFYWSALFDVMQGSGQQVATPYATEDANVVSLNGDMPAVALPWLWQQAAAEWF